MKISSAEEQIKVYCRIITDETNYQYPDCIAISSSTALELIEKQDHSLLDIFGKRDKILNSPLSRQKENNIIKSETSNISERFSFDRVFSESDSLELIFNHLALDLKYNHCIINLYRSNLFTMKNGLILSALKLAFDQNYKVEIGMACISLGIVQSIYSGYKYIEDFCSGIKHFFELEYFSSKRAKEDIYVTTFILTNGDFKNYIQFADISILGKNTDVLAKVFTNCDFSRDGRLQAKDQLVQILSKSICFGGKIHIFGNVQKSLPFLVSNRNILYYIDHIIQNRGKNRNAYTELLLKEVRKLQKENLKILKKSQFSTQVLLGSQQIREESQVQKAKNLETIVEEESQKSKKIDSDVNQKMFEELKELEIRHQETFEKINSLEKAKQGLTEKIRTLEELTLQLGEKNKSLEQALSLSMQSSSEWEGQAKKMTAQLSEIQRSKAELEKVIETTRFAPQTIVLNEIDQLHHYYYQLLVAITKLYESQSEYFSFAFNSLKDSVEDLNVINQEKAANLFSIEKENYITQINVLTKQLDDFSKAKNKEIKEISHALKIKFRAKLENEKKENQKSSESEMKKRKQLEEDYLKIQKKVECFQKEIMQQQKAIECSKQEIEQLSRELEGVRKQNQELKEEKSLLKKMVSKKGK